MRCKKSRDSLLGTRLASNQALAMEARLAQARPEGKAGWAPFVVAGVYSRFRVIVDAAHPPMVCELYKGMVERWEPSPPLSRQRLGGPLCRSTRRRTWRMLRPKVRMQLPSCRLERTHQPELGLLAAHA